MCLPVERCGWRDGAGSGAGRGGRLDWPRGDAAWKWALLGQGCVWEKSWYVGVLVHEDMELGSVLKQKGWIFSFEMAFLLSWSIKWNIIKRGGGKAGKSHQ